MVTDTSFEIHRRVGIYGLLGGWCLVLAAGFAWLAYDSGSTAVWVVAGVLGLLALIHLWGLLDARTPLFVADGHGVRMRDGRAWIGLLWSEMGDIRIEGRDGVRHDPRVKVVPADGQAVYTAPLGIVTDTSPDEAREQLARLRPAASY